MFCIECGRNIKSSAKFCASCGTKQVFPIDTASTLTNTNNSAFNSTNQSTPSGSGRPAYRFGYWFSKQSKLIKLIAPIFLLLVIYSFIRSISQRELGNTNSDNISQTTSQIEITQEKKVKRPAGADDVVSASENCAKVMGITSAYAERVSQIYNVSKSSIHFIRSDCEGNAGSFVVIDTPVGVKRCYLASVIWTEEGDFLAYPLAKVPNSDGKFWQMLQSESSCSQ